MTQRARAAAGALGTVLVVDGDPSVRLRARRLLEAANFRVLDAGDLVGAEQIVTLYVGPIHVLLVDVDISAGGLADRLRSLRPELAVLLTSGRPRRELVGAGRLDARTPFVPQPFEKTRLVAEVREVLGRPR